MTEIKLDKNTLPQHGEHVKYQEIDTLEWRIGKYDANEETFYTEDKLVWSFAVHVSQWETLQTFKS